jgi:Fe-S-cluster containining protein
MSDKLQIFSDYHSNFKGDMEDACACCGGKCEQYKIATLLPDEKDYMASHFGIPVSEFEDRFLDRLDTPYGFVDVLKMKDRCPFLDSEYSCLAGEVKPVLCDSYPIIFDVRGSRVQFKLDWHNCSAVRLEKYSSSMRKFAREGIKALRNLKVPGQWWKIVQLYDNYDYDYAGFERERSRPGYETFPLETVLGYACNGHEAEARRKGISLLSIRFKMTIRRAVAKNDNRKIRSSYVKQLAISNREFLRRLDIDISRELERAASYREFLFDDARSRYLATIIKIREAIGEIESRNHGFVENEEPVKSNISVSQIKSWLIKETGI